MIDVANVPAALEYRATLDGEQVGLIRYTIEGDTISMLHTDVAPQHEHEGIGTELVQRALDDVRARGQHVRPLCPFVAAFIAENSAYGDLVAD